MDKVSELALLNLLGADLNDASSCEFRDEVVEYVPDLSYQEGHVDDKSALATSGEVF